MTKKEYSFPSTTGVHNVYARLWLPEGKVRGVVQICHGMAEHGDRYEEFAQYLCNAGLAVACADHVGHGKSYSGNPEDYGYFGSKDGHIHLAEDQARLVDTIKVDCPNVPYILFGHSMGSFIARRFTAFFADKIDAVIYCGTAGSNPAASIGKVVCNTVAKLSGEKCKSKLIDGMAFGTYNKRTEGRTNFDWLSTNTENVDKYIADPECGNLFSATGYRDLMDLLIFVNSDKCYNAIPKDLKIYMIAGEEDPVGAYGDGVTEVFTKLLTSGHTDVELKLYPGMRHEIHNETGREEVYADVLAFVNSVIEK